MSALRQVKLQVAALDRMFGSDTEGFDEAVAQLSCVLDEMRADETVSPEEKEELMKALVWLTN